MKTANFVVSFGGDGVEEIKPQDLLEAIEEAGFADFGNWAIHVAAFEDEYE